MKVISFVIPCYRSAQTIDDVIDEIEEKVGEREDLYRYEVITINDCSPDNVMSVLRARAQWDTHLKVISLAGNVGKHVAVLVGYRVATGSYVVSVDDDGQCPMQNLWDLIDPLEAGHDMSMADYGRKEQGALKRFGSAVNHVMSRALLGKPDGVVFSNFIARRDYVCKAMASYRNSFAYLEGLSLRITRDIVMVPMRERGRVKGVSNYTFGKSLRLWLNGFTAFSVKPLRIATFLGGATALISFIFGVIALIQKLLGTRLVSGYTSIIVAILFCSGLILLQLGLLGEYIGRIYISANRYPQYVIKEIINAGSKDASELEA